MPKAHGAATKLALLLNGSSAGELILEPAGNGMQELIALEATAVIAAGRHERIDERLSCRHGYGPAASPPRWATSVC